MRGGDRRQDNMAHLLEKHAISILLGSVFVTLLMASQLFPLPEFSTEVSDFAPPDESEAQIKSIESEFPPQASRIYINVKTTNESSNPLSIPSLQELLQEEQNVAALAIQRDVEIISQINVAITIDILMKERDQLSELSAVSEWSEIVDVIEDGEDCTSIAGESAVTSTASFTASVLVSSDLTFDELCDYLDGVAESDPTPRASSTMWIIEVSQSSNPESLRVFSLELRDYLTEKSASGESHLSYGVVSEELVSEDINEGTLSNFTGLLAISLIVIVAILAMAFRSAVMVAAPLIALTAALSWTYGSVALAGAEFTVLDIAVAPVILGLGIDYGIHMQRGYERNLAAGMKPARAWVGAFSALRLALSLSVITTVTAFLSNALSPIDPLQAFGTTLAVGVVCAFTASTVTVGAIHVVSERTTGRYSGRGPNSSKIWSKLSEFQDKGLPKVMVAVAILTMASALVSVGRLETSFELTDFLDDDMESMETRDEIYSNYDVEFIKTAIVLMEFDNGSEAIEDQTIMATILGLHSRFVLDDNIIRPDGTENSRPQYEGLYTVLRDKLEVDSGWGAEYGIEIFDGKVGLSADHEEGDLADAIFDLSRDTGLGDPLRGHTWGDRISRVVVLDNATGSFSFLMMDVSVTAASSEDTDSIADQFKRHASWLQSEGACGCNVYLSGEIIEIEAVLDGLFISQLESTGLSLVASFLVLMAMTRRFSTSAVIILPVALAGIWVVGTMALVGLNWNVLTVMITALTIGLGIDYSIHMWRRFEDEMSQGAGRVEAMSRTYSVTGSALLMSAFTTASGFLVLILSPIPVIQDFGFVSASSVALSLILALFVLPSLLLSEAKARGRS